MTTTVAEQPARRVPAEAIIVTLMAVAVLVAAGMKWVQRGGDPAWFGFAALAALVVALFFGRWWPAVLAMLAVALAVGVLAWPGATDAAPLAEQAQQAAQGAAQRIRTVVQQYAPPAPSAEADAPALRQPKPGVTWDGKSIKAGKVVEEPAPKAQPVDEPKYGKAIPTPAPLVAQPVKPSKAQPTTEKVERQGKAVGP